MPTKKKKPAAAAAAGPGADGAPSSGADPSSAEADETAVYVVLSCLHFGDVYQAGEEIELTPEQAAPLLGHTVALKS